MSSSTPQGKSGLDGFDGPPFSHDFHILRLPKPTAKPKPNEPPPFKPVPVLNELHEPPPSAGLFPPITPNLLHDDTGKPLSNTLFSIQPERGAPKDTQGGEEASSRDAPSSTAGTAGTAEDDKDSKQKAKRICLRGRLKWTEEETEDLMKGVAVYGVGKWKKILVHPDLYFHPDRTMVDLKDRYRTCRMNEEKAIERQAMGKRPAGKAELRNRRNSSSIELPNLLVPERSKSSSPAPPPPPPAPSLPPILPPLPPPTASNAEQISPTSSEKECCFEITTPNLYYQEQNPSSPKGKKAPAVQPWSEEEDAALSKGYQKYGFQWTAIAKDADFCLGRRSGAQVRDRFRLKYPIVYQSSIPLPLPETQKRAPRKKGSRRLSVASKDGADHAHQNNNNNNKPPGHRQQPSKSSAAAAETSFIAHDPEPLAADKSGRMTYRMFDPTKESQPEQEAWSHHQHQHHPHQGHRHRRWSGVDAQPLPDPDPEGEGELIPMASTPPTSPPSTAALRSRQASMEADDARHLHQHQHQSLHHHHHYTHPNHHQQHQHQHQHHQHQQHQHMMGSSIFDLLNVDESEHDNENENEHEHGHDDEREHENEHEGEEQQVVAGGGGGGSGGGSGGGGSRLPPFKYTFDDDDINEWAANSQGGGGGGGGGGSGGGGGGGSGVTLPPLLWEDLASRPIFELE